MELENATSEILESGNKFKNQLNEYDSTEAFASNRTKAILSALLLAFSIFAILVIAPMIPGGIGQQLFSFFGIGGAVTAGIFTIINGVKAIKDVDQNREIENVAANIYGANSSIKLSQAHSAAVENAIEAIGGEEAVSAAGISINDLKRELMDFSVKTFTASLGNTAGLQNATTKMITMLNKKIQDVQNRKLFSKNKFNQMVLNYQNEFTKIQQDYANAVEVAQDDNDKKKAKETRDAQLISLEAKIRIHLPIGNDKDAGEEYKIDGKSHKLIETKDLKGKSMSNNDVLNLVQLVNNAKYIRTEDERKAEAAKDKDKKDKSGSAPSI